MRPSPRGLLCSRHLLRLLLSTLLLGLVAACGGGDGQPDPMARFTGQMLDWRECDATLVSGGMNDIPYADTIKALGTRVRCTLMWAPLDYANPDRGEVAIALLRVAAESASDRRGAILFNPGGPGDDGLFLAPLFARLWMGAKPDGTGASFREIARRYDIVGFSPRGTGASTRLVCATNEHAPFVASTNADRSPANVQAMLDAARLQAQACRKNPLTPFINTDATVRDMDLVRQLLRDDKLNYFGFSYGSWLGVWYASVFPERTGRLVLSGSVDVTTTLPGVFLLQGMGMQRALDQAIAPYAARHDDRYALGSDVAAIRRIQPALPIPLRTAVSEVLQAGIGNARHAEETTLALRAAQLLSSWLPARPENLSPTDLAALEAAIAAKIDGPQAFVRDPALNAIAQDQARTISAGYFYLARRTTEPVELTANVSTQWAVACNDTAPGWTEAAWVAENDRDAALYPFLGGYWTPLPCLYWGGPSVLRPSLEGARQFGGTLILHGSLDPQTPLEGALKTFAALPGSSLVQVDGEYTHGVLPPYGNDCVDLPFVDYMLAAKQPPREATHCPANPLPADVTKQAGVTTKALGAADRRSALFTDPALAEQLTGQIQDLVSAKLRPTPRH